MTAPTSWTNIRTQAMAHLSRAQRWQIVRARAERLLKFDPNQPRDPPGSPTGGQWTSGGGAESKPEAQPAAGAETAEAKGKKKADFSDFDKDNIQLDHETTTNAAKKEKFLARWNERVSEAPADFRKQFLGGLKGTMSIHYRDTGDQLDISGALHDDDGHVIGEYRRTLDLDDNYAKSDYFKLYRAETGAGIGKQMLAANVSVYQKLGFDKVKVYADIDVGGYAWAKYGYVPTRDSWRGLAGDIRGRLMRNERSGRPSPSGNTYTPESWNELSTDQQEDIERAWMRSTHAEFLDSEINNWRDSGGALDDAKRTLADDYGRDAEWAQAAMERWRERREDNEQPAVPFTDQQILNAITVGYDSDGEGRNDADIAFDDTVLDSVQPAGFDPNQATLPGIEPVKPHELLTEEIRDEITAELTKSFEKEAEDQAWRIDPPPYLADNLDEYQGEYWDSMDERDRYRWARDNNELPEIEIEPEDEPEDEPEPVTPQASAADALQRLLRSDNPKALWAIADSAQGKELLLNTGWSGELDLRDKDTMDRFNAYVSKRKK